VDDLAQVYLDHMETLKDRLAMAEHVLTEAQVEGAPKLIHVELMALHLRKTLELIAFASLVANKERYAEVYADFETHWNAKRLLGNLRKINPEFYPMPIDPMPNVNKADAEVLQFDILRAGYLTEEDFVELYGHTSRVLHQPNPFRSVVDWSFRRPMYEWIDRIIMLMRLHRIRLVDATQYWIIKLASEEDGESRLLTAVSVNHSQAQ
jgi:hypothetical protein